MAETVVTGPEGHEVGQPFAELAGRRALVVGAGQGMGRASARLLARHGVDVALVDLEAGRAGRLAEELAATGIRTAVAVGDVTDPGAARRVVEEGAEALGGLDILVNIVGRNAAIRVADLTPEDLSSQLAHNLEQHVYVAGAFSRLPAQGGDRAAVFVASVSSFRAIPGMGGYAAAKAGLVSMTATMAVEWAPAGIRVNAVAPGLTSTDRNQWGPQVHELARRSIPLGRLGHQDDVANAVLFLVSDLSSYVTGQTLLVDGGMTLETPFPFDELRR